MLERAVAAFCAEPLRQQPRDKARDDRQRDRRDAAPDYELRPEERQLPHQRPRVAKQRPARDESHRRADVGTNGNERRRNRKDGDRSAGTDHACDRRDHEPHETGFRTNPAQHHLARHQHRHEGRDQTGRQNLWENFKEQLEIAGEDFKELLLPVAEIDRHSRAAHHGRNEDGRPVEGLALSALQGRFVGQCGAVLSRIGVQKALVPAHFKRARLCSVDGWPPFLA